MGEEEDVPEKGLFHVDNPTLIYGNVHRAIQFANSCLPSWDGVSAEFLAEVHRLTMDGLIPDDGLGCYRTRNVAISRSMFTPPHYERVPELMEALLSEINTDLTGSGRGPCHVPTIVRSLAKVYYCAYRIQPFENGNKRVLRILLSTMSRVHGLRQPIINKYDNADLFRQYEEVNKRANLAPFELFVTDQLLKRYTNGDCPAGSLEDLIRIKLTKHKQQKEIDSKDTFSDSAFTLIWSSFNHPCFD